MTKEPIGAYGDKELSRSATYHEESNRMHSILFRNLMKDMVKIEAKASCALDGETQYSLPNGLTPCGKTPEELFKRKEEK